MIELDLSYEQSKKILELGYDFGRKFGDIYKKRDCPQKYILVKYEKTKAQDYFYQPDEKYYNTHVERFTLERQSIDYEESIFDDLKLHEHFELGEIFNNPNSEGFVSIIPEAALEKCLPLKLDEPYHISGQEPKIIKKCFFRSMYEVYVISKYHEDQFYIDFNNAYEAFLWLHENYSEELKAKFHEVMGGETK